uniref:Uncharacterized protein n=1 Tax=Anguilla anguilla TaxID=7936 RepID=A0A0E9SAH5_ANGAN
MQSLNRLHLDQAFPLYSLFASNVSFCDLFYASPILFVAEVENPGCESKSPPQYFAPIYLDLLIGTILQPGGGTN